MVTGLWWGRSASNGAGAMSEQQQQDKQVEQAAQQAHEEIARMHESATAELRGQRGGAETQEESVAATS